MSIIWAKLYDLSTFEEFHVINQTDHSDKARADRARLVQEFDDDATRQGIKQSPFMKELGQRYIEGEVTFSEAMEIAKRYHEEVERESPSPF